MADNYDGKLKFGTEIDQKGFQSGLSKIGGLAKSGLSNIGGLAKSGLNTLGGMVSGLGSAVEKGLQITTGAVAAASAGVTVLGKQALDAYADYEQLVGGVETLFGKAADTVMENAARAFRTAGMSANAYMETATASAAAMVNSLGGDTQKAAELTDMAVTDMADNINKMGSAAENVQNAYAGFAKGNFTMLDNLKLGYGGTKSEMERLLKTAQELTGVEYSIDSYSDIVQAIHAIQDQMGITGTTAAEAASTISGSVAMVKAAWDNLLVGVADDTQDFDKLADELVSSVETAAGNILPRAESIGGGIVRLIGALGDDAVKLLTDALGYAPDIADTGVQLIGAVASGLSDNLPALMKSGKDILRTLASGIINTAPILLDTANGLTDGLLGALNDPQIGKRLLRMAQTVIGALGDGLSRNLPLLLEAGAQLLPVLLETITEAGAEALPELLAFGGQLLGMLAGALLDNLPLLLEIGTQLLGTFGGALLDNLPLLLDTGKQIILDFVNAIADPENLAAMTEAGTEIISLLVSVLTDPEFLPVLFAAGLDILLALVTGISENLPALVGAAVQIIGMLGEAIAGHAVEIAAVGLTLLTAIVDAIFENLPLLADSALAIIKAFVDAITEPENMEKWAKAGSELLSSLLGAVCDLVEIGYNAGDFVRTLFEEIGTKLGETDWAALGKAILDGIFSGLLGVDFDFYDYLDNFGDNWGSGLGVIKDNFVAKLKENFEIHSPSRVMHDEIGENLALGIGEGFTDEMPEVIDDVSGVEAELVRQMQVQIDPETVEMLRGGASLLPGDRFLQPSPASYITNNYSSTSYTTNRTDGESAPAAPGGDIIIPVQIGGQQLETVVIKAAQIANARSGGVTI